MGFRDRLQNLKDSVGQWADGAAGGSQDNKIEKNLTEMSAGTEIQRTAAIKALVIQAQTEEKWLDPIIDSFLRVLPDQMESPQEALIEGLMELRKVRPKRAKEIFEGMQSALDSPYPSVRSRVIDIWTTFSLKSKAKNSDTIADLFEMLSDDDKDVRYQTQESLSKIMNTIPKAALPALKQALRDDDWRVVYHSIVLLTEFAKKYPKPSVALAPEVVSAFNSGEKLKERAADCLGMLGLADPHSVKGAVPGLIKGIESKSSELRKAAAKAVGRIGSKDAMVVFHAVPKLAKVLKNDDWYVHTEVVKALGYIGSNKPTLVKPQLPNKKNTTTTHPHRNIYQTEKTTKKKDGGK